MPDSANNPFWGYSLWFYASPEVAPACIDLQDRLGTDVNLLLFCCWAGSRGRALEEADLDSLIAATADWRREVIEPLRAARRALRRSEFSGARELYDGTMAQELAAERIAQDRLNEVLPLAGESGGGHTVKENLTRYLDRFGLRDPAADTSAAVLLAAAEASQN